MDALAAVARACPEPSLIQSYGPAVLAAVIAVVGGWAGGYHVMKRQVDAQERRDRVKRFRDFFGPRLP